MKILHSEPAKDGFSMPAEFSRHYGCIMIGRTGVIRGSTVRTMHERLLPKLRVSYQKAKR